MIKVSDLHAEDKRDWRVRWRVWLTGPLNRAHIAVLKQRAVKFTPQDVNEILP
jgi:hypothetical protein